jgi:prevent-host-death family protein
MTKVSVHEAKTHLSRLIEKVLAGEEVIVERNHKPVIKLVPAEPPKKKPLLGALMGKVEFNLDDGFFDPLPKEELDAWYNGKI